VNSRRDTKGEEDRWMHPSSSLSISLVMADREEEEGAGTAREGGVKGAELALPTLLLLLAPLSAVTVTFVPSLSALSLLELL
jgi:hypothetical protein